MTFRHVFGDDPIRLTMVPSRYVPFHPEDWWKHRRYVLQVIVEYQKLIFYTVRYFI
jgi:hypothetical protein